MSENIIITSQMYVGYKPDSKKSRLGFATYFEENAACRKRQATIDKWSHEPAGILDNAPRAGFKLAKSVTHGGGWNDTSTYWRVVDPLGFELEITPGNLGKLFQYCVIDKGVLDQECVWGWDKANGSKPVLLPVNSEHFKASVKTTERHNAKSLSLKDLSIGDMVELKNGTKGIFFGLVTYGYYVDADSYERGMIKFDTSYIIKTNVYDQKEGELYFVKTPKVLSAEDGDVQYTTDEAAKVLNDFVAKRKASSYMAFHTAGNNHHVRNTVFFTYAPPSTCKAELVIQEMNHEEVLKFIRSKGKRKDAHSIGAFPEYVNPFILRRGKDLFTIYEPTHPRYGYHNEGHKTDVGLFLKGDSNNFRMKCHKIDTSVPMNTENGIKLLRNPEYNPDDQSYYARNRPKFLEFEVDLCDCQTAMLITAEIEGIKVDFYDTRNH